MNEQPLDLKRFVQAMRRRWSAVVALAVIGACSGVAYAILHPAMPKATALVILSPGAATSQSGFDITTQSIIATSTPVLDAAGYSLSPPLKEATLRQDVQSKVISSEILQIQASAPTSGEAVRIADAVSSQYVRYATSDDLGTTKVTLDALQADSTQLAKQIQGLQDQIDVVTARLVTERASSANGERDTYLLASLRAEQQQLSVELDNINDQIISTQFSGSLAAGATAVLQKATPVSASALRVPELGAIGAAAGLLLGCVVALAGSRSDRRLRLRDEIAAAIGVPVLASIDSPVCKTNGDWKRLLANYEPSPADTWSARRVLYHLSQSDPAARAQVTVVAFADDAAGIAAGARLAKAATSLGFPVSLVPGPHGALVGLRATARAVQVQETGSSDQVLFFGANGAAVANDGEAPSQPGVSSLMMSLAVIDGDKLELSGPNGATVLAVSAGFATVEALSRAALAATQAGRPLDGIVVVNPDPADSTTGSVPRDNEAPTVMHKVTNHRPSTQAPAGRATR